LSPGGRRIACSGWFRRYRRRLRLRVCPRNSPHRPGNATGGCRPPLAGRVVRQLFEYANGRFGEILSGPVLAVRDLVICWHSPNWHSPNLLKVRLSGRIILGHALSGPLYASLTESAGSRAYSESERVSILTETLMSKSIAVARTMAYSRQSGRCFYCDLPMWLSNSSDFVSKYGLTLLQAKRLRCTGEHLHARQDGGTDSKSNIVAACWTCNQGRHRRKKAPPPYLYKEFVRKQMSRRRWHNSQIIKQFQI